MGNKIYSSGNVVTYYVDNSSVYSEEFDEGEDILSPKTFTPSKSGYTFTGWRTDKEAAADVLSGVVMADSPITLYAVFGKTITLSYNGNGNTEGSEPAGNIEGVMPSQTGISYYNNGNIANPSFTLAANGFTINNYIFYRWTMGSTDGVQYAPGAGVTLSSDTTFYAYWVQNTHDYGYTGGIQTFTVPHSGTYLLEVWGAEGGRSYRGNAGGLGGYARGSVYLTYGTNLYIAAGGAGTTGYGVYDDEGDLIEVRDTAGGYNGGGIGAHETGSGGGATHIGTFNSTLAEHGNTSGLYIVAGGGGGGMDYQSGGYNIVQKNGGNGGGITGDDGIAHNHGCGGTGGSDTQGGLTYCYDYEEAEGSYYDWNKGSFGQGADGGAAGGGGLYGGGACISDPWGAGAGGGGGSGYIKSVESGRFGESESELRSGSGYARITIQSLS